VHSCNTPHKKNAQSPPRQHPISAFGFANHDETSFHKPGVFHESFITEPLALRPNQQFYGSRLCRIWFSLAEAVVSNITKRLSCHVSTVHACSTARTILKEDLVINVRASRCRTMLRRVRSESSAAFIHNARWHLHASFVQLLSLFLRLVVSSISSPRTAGLCSFLDNPRCLQRLLL
jgi:hypothetical protein